jgi:acetyl-CoA acetyltransferase
LTAATAARFFLCRDLNEAFASQRCLNSRDKLGIDPANCNVNGGSIALPQPFGMTGTSPATSCRKAPPQDQVGRRHHVHRRRPGRRGGN